jgi:hypothetical protein
VDYAEAMERPSVAPIADVQMRFFGGPTNEEIAELLG